MIETSNKAFSISQNSFTNINTPFRVTKENYTNTTVNNKHLKEFEDSSEHIKSKNNFKEETKFGSGSVYVIKLSKEQEEEAFHKQKEISISNYKLSQTFNFEKLKSTQMKDYIKELNEKIEKIKYDNEAMIYSQFQEDIEKDHLEISQKQITTYCNDMKRRSLNIEGTIKEYESILHSKKEDFNHTKQEYEKHIRKAEEENSVLKKANNKLLSQSDNLRNNIRELELNIDAIFNDIESEKIIYNEKDLLNKIKYEKLEVKFSELQRKAYTIKEEFKKSNSKITSNKNITVNKSYRVKKAKKHHEMNINEIKNEIVTFENENNILENSIKEKQDYLAKLLLSVKTYAENAIEQPSYLKTNRAKSKDLNSPNKMKSNVKSSNSTRPQTVMS